MKKIFLLTSLLSFSVSAFAQKYMTRTGKVTFFSATSLENIEAVNNQSALVIDGTTGAVAAKIPIKSFHFEKALMQEHFNENYMESNKFPMATFSGKVVNLGAVDFSKNGTYYVSVTGKMTMHGVTKTVTVSGSIVVNGSQITAGTKFNINPKDYNISIPAVVAGKISESIAVTVNCVLKAK